MIKRFEYFYTLYNNIFAYIPIIYSFYNEYHGQEKDILLSYLILPLTLNEKSRKKLLNSNSRSSLFTFCQEKDHLIGISEKAKQYKFITNDCIQYGLDKGLFKINPSLHMSVENKLLDMDTNTAESKAAEKLADIFKSLDIATIYRYLGVIEL